MALKVACYRPAWLLVAVCLGGRCWAQPYVFSHRTHLALKLECVRCHPGAPKRTRPVLKREEIISEDACRECHGEAILNLAPAPPPRVAHFSHALHLKLIRGGVKTSNACAACHRGLPESDEVNRSLMPVMADCLVCHVEVKPPETCYRCHATDAQLRPASHTPEFITAHGGQPGVEKECRACHPRSQ